MVLTFRFLIYFEFIFIYGLRECSNFIVLHVYIFYTSSFSRDCFFLFILYSCCFCCRLMNHRCWALCPALLICETVFAPVLHCFDYCRLQMRLGLRSSHRFTGGESPSRILRWHLQNSVPHWLLGWASQFLDSLCLVLPRSCYTGLSRGQLVVLERD